MIDTCETKMSSVSNDSKKTPKLSFSISRILSKDEDKKQTLPRTDERTAHVAEPPRVPCIGTIHHYAMESIDNSHLDIHVQPRACSTPENNEYPSPTPYYQYGHHVHHLQQPHFPLYHTSPNFYKHGTIATPETTDIPLKSTILCSDISSDKSLDSLGESYQNSPSPLKMKKKKSRTVFSRNQVYQLESAFDVKRYLSSAERAGLAVRLNLSETQIKIWFQNRRNKWKRQINGEMDEIPIPPGFAAGFMPQQPYCPPSLNSLGHVMESPDELLRNRLTASSYFAHPYSQEHRRPLSFLH